MKKHRGWTSEQIDMLYALYPDMLAAELAHLMGKGLQAIYHMARQLGIEKSDAFKNSPESGRLLPANTRGHKTQFKKGHDTWNKGTKGLQLGGKETQFKPGHRGGRGLEIYKPIGAERISKDGYLERKIHDGRPFQSRWRAVHLLVWEAENGPLPKGCAIRFKDGNKLNIALENLELISRADLMRGNSIHRYGPEIANLCRLKGAVNRQIKKRERAEHEQY